MITRTEQFSSIRPTDTFVGAKPKIDNSLADLYPFSILFDKDIVYEPSNDGSDEGSKDDLDDEIDFDPAEAEASTELVRNQSRNRYNDDFMNGYYKIKAGPDCRELYPWLTTDSYVYDSILDSVELREIIASTTMAVLDDAETITTVVGEDTSGRIPALIMGKAINMVRRHQGLEPARRVFMSGRIDKTQTPEFSALPSEDRALFVTEYIYSGASANGSLAALCRAGYRDPAVATLDRNDGEWFMQNRTIQTNRMYMGDRRSYTERSDIHLTIIPPALKGVRKEKGLAHSEAAVLDKQERAQLVTMRADIDHFAEEIVAMWYILQQEA